MKKTIRGFTLVELLIVIVVIAILAAISVVAYSGIRDRSEAVRAASVASQVSKLIDLYYIDHGRYPESEPNAGFTPGETCIGHADNYPASDGYIEGQCLYNTSDPEFKVGVSSTLMSDLEVYGTVPDASIGKVLYVNEYWRGIRYVVTSNSSRQGAWIEWVIKGDYRSSCGPDARGSYYSWLDTTHCVHGFGTYSYL